MRWQYFAYRSVKRQDEAALGVIFCGGAVTAVSPALQILKAVVGVVQHGCLLARLLSADIPTVTLAFKDTH